MSKRNFSRMFDTLAGWVIHVILMVGIFPVRLLRGGKGVHRYTRPEVLTDGDGNIWVFYNDWAGFNSGQEGYVARMMHNRFSPDRQWDPPRSAPSRRIAQAKEPHLSAVLESNGDILLFWNHFPLGLDAPQYTNTNIKCSRLDHNRITDPFTGWEHWGPEQEVTPLAPPAFDVDLTAVADSWGGVWVFWCRYDGSPTIWFRGARHNRWGPETQLSTTGAGGSRPAAVVDRSGAIWVFWVDGGWSTIVYRRHTRGSWQPEEELPQLPSSGGRFLGAPCALVSENGDIWVFWTRRQQPSHLHASLSVWCRRQSHGSWGPEIRLSDTTEDAFLGSAVEDGSGDIFVFWTTLEKQQIHSIRYCRHRPFSAPDNWLPPLRLGLGWGGYPHGDFDPDLLWDLHAGFLDSDAIPDVDDRPQAAVDKNGAAWVFWLIGAVNGGADLVYRRIS